MNLAKWWVSAVLCTFTLSAAAEQPIQQATLLLDAGKTRDAEVILTALLEREPGNAQAHELLGDVFRHEGRATSAEREYRKAYDLGIHDAELLSSLATVEKWDRHFSDARVTYRRELEASPIQKEAREELKDLEYQRGLNLFGAYGGWETDTTTKGWQATLNYGGLDRIDPFLGASYADKYFYIRRSYSAKAYAFLSPGKYIKGYFEQDNYNYPVAITPVPDANAYMHVPTAGLELAGDVSENLRGTVSYEFFRPNFFFDPAEHANNHKVSGELQYRTRWQPLKLIMQGALLRDPDPDRTIVDKSQHLVVPAYSMQYLVGGGAQFSFSKLEGQILALPNRDLDRSTDYSILSLLNAPLGGKFRLRAGHVFDHYSNQSVFTGQIAQVYNAGVSWRATRAIELAFGGKVVRRPIRNDQAIYVTTTFRLPIR